MWLSVMYAMLLALPLVACAQTENVDEEYSILSQTPSASPSERRASLTQKTKKQSTSSTTPDGKRKISQETKEKKPAVEEEE